jgi:hypothetical protein
MGEIRIEVKIEAEVLEAPYIEGDPLGAPVPLRKDHVELSTSPLPHPPVEGDCHSKVGVLLPVQIDSPGELRVLIHQGSPCKGRLIAGSRSVPVPRASCPARLCRR